MGSLNGRIQKLESAIIGRPGRCVTCREWPEWIVRYLPPAEPPSGMEPADVPAVCPSCGWQPSVFVVGYAPEGSTWAV